MNPVIVGSRVYTDLGAAIADSDGKSFTYSEARMAPATIPTGEAFAQLMIAALTEINPHSETNTILWNRFTEDAIYECHHLSSKLGRSAATSPTWSASEPQEYSVAVSKTKPKKPILKVVENE